MTEGLARCATGPGTSEVSLTYRVLAPDGSERRHTLRARASTGHERRGRVLGVLEDATEARLPRNVARGNAGLIGSAAMGDD